MIQKVAPSRSRGCSRVLLAVALGTAWPMLALAQQGGRDPEAPPQEAGDQPSAKEDAKAAGKPAAVGRDEAQKRESAVDTTKIKKVPPTEVWRDPNAEAALQNTFTEIRGPSALSQADREAVDAMATRPGNFQAGPVQKYISFYVADITRHANIDALLKLSAGVDANGDPFETKDLAAFSDRAKKIQEASRRLYDPLAKAAEAKNVPFREQYVKALIPFVRDLLKNHFFARIQGIVVLSRSAEPEAIPVFIDAIKDAKQVMAVKTRAAVGIANAADWGRRTLDPGKYAIPAAGALADFLDENPDAFWPVKVRALEALGSLRQSTHNPLREQADYATAAVKYLADPKARPAVRARAAWALGMMRFNPNTRVNFPLLIHQIGELATEVGSQVVETDPEFPGRAKELTDLLVTLIVSLDGNGDAGIDGAGLLKSGHPRLSGARELGQQVDKHIRDLAKAAIELSQGPAERKPPEDAKKAATFRNPRAPLRSAVSNQVNSLKSYLAKNPPESRSLVPGGPEFPGAKAQVAAGEKR